MSWKNILKREKLPLIPDEAMFNIPTGNLKSPPESRYFENAKVDIWESLEFVGKEMERRYVPNKAQLDDLRTSGRDSKPLSDERVESRRKAAMATYNVAEKAIKKVVDPYMDFLNDWSSKETLQEANKEWEYLTHRVMLTVHTALNNLFPTVEDAYRSRKLNGFLHWKGEYYQNLMKKELTDTMEDMPKTKPAKREPEKRNYMAERRATINRKVADKFRKE